MTTRSFPITGPIRLIARVGAGKLHVDARDDVREAVVTLSGRGAEDAAERGTIDMRGNVLIVALPRKGGILDFLNRLGGQDAVDVDVVVPSGTQVKVNSFTGDIAVSGRVGAADLASGAAAITVDDVDGNLRLRFGSGTADVVRVAGTVQARAGSGSCRFGEVGGAFTAACGSGNISVGTAHGPVKTRAGSGDATVEAVHGDVDFVSGSGNVTLGLPPGRSARLDVTTGSGRVESDMPVEAQATTGTTPLHIRVRTGSGDIRLVRAA
jgi:DUF4097 and DUF4098 domain-containing protein YvlB